MPLSDFAKAFNLEQYKEVMPYSLYAAEFVSGSGFATREQILQTPNFDKFDDLFKNLTDWGCTLDGEKFDMIRYSKIYCEAAVRELSAGWRVFRDKLLEKYSIDAFSYPTMASLSDAYMT